MKKSKAAVILAVILAAFVGLAYYASIILSSTGVGEDMSIPLGLDLSGGVSITYQVVDENPSAEDMSDTIYKLQKRVDSYSTEASVYQVGDDRITVEIPGVQDANEILEDLGNPGSLEFQMPDGTVFMTGDMVADAQAATQIYHKMEEVEIISIFMSLYHLSSQLVIFLIKLWKVFLTDCIILGWLCHYRLY